MAATAQAQSVPGAARDAADAAEHAVGLGGGPESWAAFAAAAARAGRASEGAALACAAKAAAQAPLLLAAHNSYGLALEARGAHADAAAAFRRALALLTDDDGAQPAAEEALAPYTLRIAADNSCGPAAPAAPAALRAAVELNLARARTRAGRGREAAAL